MTRTRGGERGRRPLRGRDAVRVRRGPPLDDPRPRPRGATRRRRSGLRRTRPAARGGDAGAGVPREALHRGGTGTAWRTGRRERPRTHLRADLSRRGTAAAARPGPRTWSPRASAG